MVAHLQSESTRRWVNKIPTDNSDLVQARLEARALSSEGVPCYYYVLDCRFEHSLRRTGNFEFGAHRLPQHVICRLSTLRIDLHKYLKIQADNISYSKFEYYQVLILK